MNYQCPDCGKINTKEYCDVCEKELSEECAVPNEPTVVLSENGEPSTEVAATLSIENNKKNRKKKILIITIVAVIAVVLVSVLAFCLTSSASVQDFNELFFDLEMKFEGTDGFIEIGADGSWMKIDTNPLDVSSDERSRLARMGDDDTAKAVAVYGIMVLHAEESIRTINEELGFSSSLKEKMEATSSIETKTESNGKYTVSWTYSSSKGIEALYEVNR